MRAKVEREIEPLDATFYLLRTGARGGSCPAAPAREHQHVAAPSTRGVTTAPPKPFTTPCEEPVRVAEGGEPARPAGSSDTRSVPATEGTRVRRPQEGERPQEKRTVVGTLGLLVAVAVTAASGDDGTAAPVVRGRVSGAESPGRSYFGRATSATATVRTPGRPRMPSTGLRW